MAGGAHFKKWNGPQISAEVKDNVAKALGRFGLVAEGNSKKELTKGHGVETGTLRRSIHTAGPEYNWAADNVEPASGTSELGGASTEGVIQGDRITLSLGSGLNYALPVHQGHHNFAGYHFLVNGLEKAKAQLPMILKAFQLK
jgi:hypothetical protein